VEGPGEKAGKSCKQAVKKKDQTRKKRRVGQITGVGKAAGPPINWTPSKTSTSGLSKKGEGLFH